MTQHVKVIFLNAKAGTETQLLASLSLFSVLNDLLTVKTDANALKLTDFFSLIVRFFSLYPPPAELLRPPTVL